jgi:xylan 1,4-beta-xylosidase
VWNYHDDNIAAPATDVTLTIAGLPARTVTLTHYRVDHDHSNAYEVWLKMGSPAAPTPVQRAELERSDDLHTLEPPRRMTTSGGEATIRMSLPRQAVSLVTVTW